MQDKEVRNSPPGSGPFSSEIVYDGGCAWQDATPSSPIHINKLSPSAQEAWHHTGKSWEFENGSSLRVILRKEDWLKVGQFLNVPENLTFESAMKIRAAVVLAPKRVGAGIYNIWDSRTLARDRDKYSRRYMNIQKSHQAATAANVIMKERNTIAESWPLQL
ncbi:uncharacterized protein BDR25DRAFT_341587 [Lindgomyces ingoldianus]|uniref:Uncharacterized protein n=1 Tax=Lindgomyces ingoldianus TaxID=673940 RepID=A0ACB6R0X6_9PLEO|nr:uncharacterized protein BDR25DRAFT_341587 [Lindgomyces ingoldianus]KAF2472697.1 hypothetical protein BDR25DRAFT_341587 [Lindgomyces ingoldianus]